MLHDLRMAECHLRSVAQGRECDTTVDNLVQPDTEQTELTPLVGRASCFNIAIVYH